MFKFLSKEKKRDLVMPKHLTKAEKKEVRQIINKAQKNDGTPMSAATLKQISCLFVRLNITLLFTFVRSRGTEIYDAAITVFLSFALMRVKY